MSYSDYIARRTLQGIPVVLGLSVVIFTISRVLPGNPVRMALGQGATTEQVKQVEREMGLNQPLHVQYFDWFTGVLQGEMGTSLRTGNDVFFDIISRFPATLELVLFSLTFAVLAAIPLGVISGMNKDTWKDHLSRIGAIFGLSMPRFWVGILLQIIFFGFLSIFPLQGRISNDVTRPPRVTGMYLIDTLIAFNFTAFLDAAWHIILPAFALGLATLAQVMRLLRSDMIEEQRKDYVLAAKAYGLPRNLLIYKYMLRNAFTSSLTIIGLAFGFLLGNAFLIEYIFAWPGMARYGVNAILFQDFNAIVGVVMVVGVGFVFVNLIVDILYGLLDPRVRLQEGE